MERRTLYQIEIKGINSDIFPKSIESYRLALKKLKCKIIIEKKNVGKSRVSFIFSSPSNLRRESIEKFLSQQVSEDERGSLDWDMGYK